MKILMPAMHYWPVIGGIETWTKEISQRLSEKAEIFVVTGRVKSQPRKEIKKGVHPVKSARGGAAKPQFNGVKIFRTSLFSLTNLSHSPLIYTLSLLPFILIKSLILIKKEKINLLHCQGFLSSFLGYLLAKITKIGYISTVQRLETKNWLKKKVYTNAVFCIAASCAVKKYFQDIGCQNIEVIPNGIDLQRFKGLDRQAARERLGVKNQFVVMTVARLEKVKGIKYLIKAMSVGIMSVNIGYRPTRDWQLVVVGDGGERRNLERLVKELGLQGKVRFLGQVANEEIPHYLAGADCFVLPSLKEGFGIAVLEAMASKVAVVATNVGGIPDIVEQGRTGILVEAGNAEGIAKAIERIYASEELRQSLVRNAADNLERYNWHNISQQVLKIYTNLC